MNIRLLALVGTMGLVGVSAGSAADLVLAEGGKTEYQIVVPDSLLSPVISNCLEKTARLVQTAFKANGADVPVVPESGRDPGRPGIYLGNTAFARTNGIDATRFKDWAYACKAVGRDVIVAGCDKAPTIKDAGASGQRLMPVLGTAKAAADFLRQYAGTRFLYPATKPWSAPLSDANLLDSPCLEFLKTWRIAIPSDLDVRKEPFLVFNTGSPKEGFYEVANNLFPVCDRMPLAHTYELAIPLSKYVTTHPEYFALIDGKRIGNTNDWSTAQYCISNPEVQELFYQWAAQSFSKGYQSLFILQTDGFRPCQCEKCRNLYGTGNDWGEKLWIFHRDLAERLHHSYPDRQVMLEPYSVTKTLPKTFKSFPPNVVISTCMSSPESFARLNEYKGIGGFLVDLQYWGGYHLANGYVTPTRTPRFLETQARMFSQQHVIGACRDGVSEVYGLEGPVYYVFGRLYDDPATNSAQELMSEFCGAAFGGAAEPMEQFYADLYHGIESYASVLGIGCPSWVYKDIKGQSRKYLTDSFQIIGFLYTPDLLATLEAELVQAERLADTRKVKCRLALVRLEFDYLKSLATVVHLSDAYRMQPTRVLRDVLLDAIDSRNALIASYYSTKNPAETKPIPGWSEMQPFGGLSPNHVTLKYDMYLSKYKDTPLNWNTQEMRNAPLSGTKSMIARSAVGPILLNSAVWAKSTAQELRRMPGAKEALTCKTVLRALFDSDSLYLRFECELPDHKVDQQELLDLVIAPLGTREKFYHFTVGPQPESKYDAANGFIVDGIDPRYGKDDPDWSGDWTSTNALDSATNRWLALLRIPFGTLGVEPPVRGKVWLGNFGRVHHDGSNSVERSIWSAQVDTKEVTARDGLGEIIFQGRDRQVGIQPMNFPQDFALAMKLYETGEIDDAQDAFLKLTNTAPTPQKTAECLRYAAYSLNRQKQYDEAILLAKTIELKPVSLHCRMQMMLARQNPKELVGMLKDEDISQWPDPLAGEGFYQRGCAYRDLGNLQAAVDDLSRAVEHPSPLSMVAAQCLGEVYEKLKNDAKALDFYGKVLAKDNLKGGPYHTSSGMAMCRILLRQGHYAEALAALAKVNDTGIGKMRILEAYGDIYRAQGKDADALAKYNEAAAVSDLPQKCRDALNQKISLISAK